MTAAENKNRQISIFPTKEIAERYMPYMVNPTIEEKRIGFVVEHSGYKND